MSNSLELLKEAAANYGLAVADLESGITCRVPLELISALTENKLSALRNLQDAAVDFHADCFEDEK